MKNVLTTIVGSALLLLTPVFGNSQEPVKHKEHQGNIGCVTFGTSQDVCCDGTVLRNFYVARPKTDGRLKEKVQEAACKVYEGGKTVVRTTGAVVGFSVEATTCIAGKLVEGVGTVENYIGEGTQRVGQFLQRACPSCTPRYYQTTPEYKCD